MDKDQARAQAWKALDDMAQSAGVALKLGAAPADLAEVMAQGLSGLPDEARAGAVEQMLAGLPEEARREVLARLLGVSPDDLPPPKTP